MIAPLGEPEYRVDLDLVRQAAQFIAPYLPPTPSLASPALGDLAGRPENRQVTGAFKVRGALFRIGALEGEACHRGVVAASAGNHALGVAWACRSLGVPGLVVVPETVSPAKLGPLRESTIKIRQAGRCYDEAEVEARRIAMEAEATFISPYDDPWIMAGNGGTVGLELLEQVPDLSAVVTPVGGGGLAAGLGAALGGIPLLGINAAASPAMARSLDERQVHLTMAPGEETLAEGLEGGVSRTSAALCDRCLTRMEVVPEAAIRRAIRFMVHHHSMVLEGSAAVGVAALLEGVKIPGDGDGPIGLILTGKNIARQALRGVLRE